MTSHVDSDQFSCRLENDSVGLIFDEDIYKVHGSLVYDVLLYTLQKLCIVP